MLAAVGGHAGGNVTLSCFHGHMHASRKSHPASEHVTATYATTFSEGRALGHQSKGQFQEEEVELLHWEA